MTFDTLTTKSTNLTTTAAAAAIKNKKWCLNWKSKRDGLTLMRFFSRCLCDKWNPVPSSMVPTLWGTSLDPSSIDDGKEFTEVVDGATPFIDGFTLPFMRPLFWEVLLKLRASSSVTSEHVVPVKSWLRTDNKVIFFKMVTNIIRP